MRSSHLLLLLKGTFEPLKGLVLIVLVPATSNLSAQTSVLLPVASDVPIGYHDNYNTANNNYNSATHLSGFSTVGTQGGENNGRTLMDFDLSVIPSGSNILGAFLNLTAHGPFDFGLQGTAGSVGQNSCTLRRVTETWNDATVTWNTQPATTSQNAVTLAQSTYPLQNYFSIDVTALVQDMVADPSSSFGFMLMLLNETPERVLVFKSGLAEHPDQRPSLLVVYGECSVGMGELGQEAVALQVSPNVGTPGESMSLSMPGSIIQPSRLEVLDTVGRLVWNGPLRQLPATWTVPALPQGAYTMIVKDQQGRPIGNARVLVR